MHVPVELGLLDAQIVLVFVGAREVITALVSLLAHFPICVCVSAESVGLRNKLLRKVQELKNECDCSGVPDEFLCPITRELMKDPVIASGRTRSARLHKCWTGHLWPQCFPPDFSVFQTGTRMNGTPWRAGSRQGTGPAP